MAEGAFSGDDGGVFLWRNSDESQEIEDLLHIMNETKVEFSIREDSYKGEGLPPLMEIDPAPPGESD